jgi:hypothetical protein
VAWGQTQITSLPYTISSGGTAESYAVYQLNPDSLTTSGSAITVNANYVEIDLTGTDATPHTSDDEWIVYGSDTTANRNGISISNGRHHIKIRGGNIFRDTTNITGFETVFDSAYFSCRGTGINIGIGCYDVVLDSINYVRVTGAPTRSTEVFGVAVRTQAYRVTIRNCNIVNRAIGLANRQDFLSACVKGIKLRAQDIPDWDNDWHIKSYGNYYETYSHCGVYTSVTFAATDSTIVWHEYDTVKIDMRNIYGETYPGNYRSNVNGYAIFMKEPDDKSYVRNCYIFAGEDYDGGRGIMVDRAFGDDSLNAVKITSNRIWTHEGFTIDPMFGQNSWYPCGIKIRNCGSGVTVDSNTVTYVADSCLPATTDKGYCPQGECIVYQYWDCAPSPPMYITFEANRCSTLTLNQDVTFTDYRLAVVKWDDVGTKYLVDYAADTSQVWRNNYLYGESNCIYDGGQYDGGTVGWLINGDTVDLDYSFIAGSNKGTFNIGMWTGVWDVWGRDIVYSGDALPTQVYYECYGWSPTNTNEMWIERTLSILVLDATGTPINGATVTVDNNYLQEVVNTTTNAQGIATGVVTYGYYSRVDADSTSFNDFTISASHEGDIADSTFTLDWDTYTDTLQFASTTIIHKRLKNFNIRGAIIK